MKYYLSSFRLGNNPQSLVSLFIKGKKVAVIGNSIDFREETERTTSIKQEIEWLNQLGLEASEIDLRKYFHKNNDLQSVLDQYNGVWVRGGNTFILRRAMLQSGFDKIIIKKDSDPNFVYGGYSAGVCVLSKDLYGLEIVDDPNVIPDNYVKEIAWKGLGLIDYYFAPHYKSDHPESELVTKEVELWKKEDKYFRVLCDGEVIIK